MRNNQALRDGLTEQKQTARRRAESRRSASESLERFIARRGRKAISSIENLCSNVNVACVLSTKTPARAMTQCTAASMSRCRERLVPGGAGVIAAPPRPTCNCLDRLIHDVSFFTHGDQAVEHRCIVGILHHEVIVG